MTVTEAQHDLRRAYRGAGPGVMISGLVWLVAGLVTQSKGISTGFIALFLGGMLIFPMSKLVLRLLFNAPNESADNPLGMIALESTIAMIGGLLGAWLLLRFDPTLVFPFAAIAVGTHYFAFKSVYGDGLFWVLGGLITMLGALEIFQVTSLGTMMIFAVAAVEAVFAVILFVRAPKGNAAYAP
ncbi:MAG TPA: hypothetical protein VNA29_08290 [Sphingomicrobium sp.]|nr:hypothetical protein [Sphingomicrobium sp.]